MNNDCVPIGCLSKDCEGVIVKLDGEEINIQRLAEMGICSGCHIKVMCAGNPCMLKINNKNICLRMNDLNVFVCPLLK